MTRGGAAALTVLESIDSFGRRGASPPLRPYQLACAEAIVRSVVRGQGRTFTIMFARQMGKNELSARIEAYLLVLFAGRGGSIVKAAPSFKPQLVNSMLRLRSALDGSPITRHRWKPSFGYIYGVGDASCIFLSADTSANVVGATASLLLELDEAQDIDPEKYTRDFRPMASSTNATTVMYGTAWSKDTLLETQKRLNLVQEERTGERLHFEYDWQALAATNASYRSFVEGEIERLGIDHPSIRTQYLLECLSDSGRLFSEEQQAKMRATHHRQSGPIEGETYVAGIDVAGADEEPDDAITRSLKPRRDSTVVAIARLRRAAAGSPAAEIVQTLWWTGRAHEQQLTDLLALWERWRFSHVAIDASGIGYGLAELLAARQGERTTPITFTRPTKSRLGYELLAMINTNRFTLYHHDHHPDSAEMWWEISHTRYRMHSNQVMSWSVPETEGHDDFVVALALAAHAVARAPSPASGALLRPPVLPESVEPW